MWFYSYSRSSLTVPPSSNFSPASGDWATTFFPLPEYLIVKFVNSFLASSTVFPTTSGTLRVGISVHSRSFYISFSCFSIPRASIISNRIRLAIGVVV